MPKIMLFFFEDDPTEDYFKMHFNHTVKEDSVKAVKPIMIFLNVTTVE